MLRPPTPSTPKSNKPKTLTLTMAKGRGASPPQSSEGGKAAKKQNIKAEPYPQDQGSESESESTREEEQAADENRKLLISAPSKPNGKSPIMRSWTFEDEIAILEAMVEHQSKHGTIRLTAEGVARVHDSIRSSLSKHVTDAKFADKLRKMREKFTSANRKGDKVKFAQPHDEVVYELSKKIWGGGGGKEKDDDGNSASREGKGSKKRDFPYISDAMAGNRLALEMLELVDKNKAMAFENKFKKLKFAEFDLVTKVHNFLLEEAQRVMN